MKSVALTLCLLTAVSSFANTVRDYTGRYELIGGSKNNKGLFCYHGLIVREKGDELALYRSDVLSEPMYSAAVNGPEKETRRGHGEGMVSKKTTTKVTLSSEGLKFEAQSRNRIIGIPANSEKESVTIKLVDQRTASIARAENRNVVYCNYKRVN